MEKRGENWAVCDVAVGKGGRKGKEQKTAGENWAVWDVAVGKGERKKLNFQPIYGNFPE